MFSHVCYCRRIPLKKVLPPDKFDLIQSQVVKTNYIIREAYQFVKAFFLRQSEHSNEIPVIDRSFLKTVFQILCKGKSRKDGKRCKQHPFALALEAFFHNHYKTVLAGELEAVGKDILDAEIIQMITAIENHIKVCFFYYVKKIPKVLIPNEKKTDGKEEKSDKPAASTMRNRLLNDLFNNTNTYGEEFKDVVKLFSSDIIRAKETLFSNPQGCLPVMFDINRWVEEKNKTLPSNKQHKLYSILPLRTTLIPCSIQLSKTICKASFKDENLWTETQSKILRFFAPKTGFMLSSLRTDGVSCSVMFKSEIKYKKEDEPKERYLQDLTADEREALKMMRIVSADPGKNTILQMYGREQNSEDEKHVEDVFLRYTNNQRKKESGTRNYKRIQKSKESGFFDEKSESTLKASIDYLKQFSSKTTDWRKFLDYCREKNKFSARFKHCYEEYFYRKFKFNRRINEQRSKDNFLNRFQDKFGPPESTILCVGDWEQRPGLSFHKEPSLGKGIRKWFKDRNYQVFLVDEFRTSKTCCYCHSENKYNYFQRKDPRPWMQPKNTERIFSSGGKHWRKKTENSKIVLQDVWALSRCINSACRAIHNRDKCSSKNLFEIATSIITEGIIPEDFRRKTQSSGD